MAFALVAVVSIAATSLIVWNSTATTLRENLRESTLARLAAAADVFTASERLVAGARVDNPRIPEALRQRAMEGRRVSYFDGERMWAAQDFPFRGVLSVSQSTEANDRFLADLVRQFVIAGLIAIALAVTVGVLIARRMAGRLARIGDVASGAAAGRFDRQVGDPRPDQVGDLARAVDRMTTNLGAQIERERRFAADVAHELRTPVAALVSASELLDDPRGQRLARDQVMRLRRLVEDLLETFKAGHAVDEGDLGPVDLAEAVPVILSRASLDVSVTVARPGWVMADERRLSRIVENLVRNAQRHGAPPVEVTVEAPCVHVRDHGPGLPDWLRDDGPQRFRTASSSRGDGVGLGLSIAMTLATVMGGSLTLANHPDGGAWVTLTLPRTEPLQEVAS